MPIRKIDSPLLVIGLGGTGAEAAYRLKKAFQEQMEHAGNSDLPPRTRFLIIDTDEYERTKHDWTGDEFFSIANNHNAIKGRLYPWETAWFDKRFADLDGLLVGDNSTGANRQIPRLYLFRRVEMLLNAIQNAILEVLCVMPGQNPGKKIHIVVFAGISGGTGSGIVLDVPYLIRYTLETIMHLNETDYSLEGMLVMPDVTIQRYADNDRIRRQLYEADGYAALKELDYWMYYESHHHRYAPQYSANLTVEWKGAPYDDLILLNATNMQNANIVNAQEHIMDTIAEYMVNCFSDDYNPVDGATEFNPTGGGGGHNAVAIDSNVMTFEAEQANVLAQLGGIRKEFFVPYRYRSIGAFSNSGDEINILNRQWNLILNESVARMDTHKPHMDGAAPGAFRAACIDRAIGCEEGSSLRTTYGDIHTIPDAFGNLEAKDLRTMSYSSSPHGDDYETFKKNIEQARGDDVATLVTKGKKELHDLFSAVVCDLEKGPDYCYTLLTHANKGLQQAIDEEREKAKTLLAESEGFIRDHSGTNGICESLASDIRKLNPLTALFELNRRYNIYEEDVKSLYNATQAAGYYRALYEAMVDLKKYVAEYAALLGEMTNGLRVRKEDYQKRVNTAQTMEADAVHLLDNDKLEGSLITAFNENEQREALVKKAFQTVSDAVDSAMQRNKTALSDFEIADIIREGIEAVRRNCFSAINSMSIETKLTTYGTLNGMSMREYTKQHIMPTLYRGATPMFHPAYTLSSELGNVVESYMGTVPISATNIEMGINDFMQEKEGNYANLKRSNIPDRLFWVTSVMGMPMMAYAGLKGIYGTYLNMRQSHAAVHLCMNECNSLVDSQRQNWSLLPEPTCVRHKALSETEAEAKACSKAGVLDIQVDFRNENNEYKPYASIHYKRLRPAENVEYITEEGIADAIEEALTSKTNMPEREQALRTLRENYDTVDITPENLKEKAEAWAIVLGLGETIHKIFTPEMPKAEQIEVQNAWRTSFEHAAYEYVSRSPQLLGHIRTNCACFDIIDQRIEEASKPDFTSITENAVIFGRMYRYGLISVSRAGAEFVSDDIQDTKCALYDPSNQDQERIMKRYFPGFTDYSKRLQNIMYYACMIGGKDPRDTLQREALDKLEKDYQKMLKTLPDDDDIELADVESCMTGVGSFISNARKLEELLEKDSRDVNQLYAEGKINDEKRQILRNVIDAVVADTHRFNRDWKDLKI